MPTLYSQVFALVILEGAVFTTADMEADGARVAVVVHVKAP